VRDRAATEGFAAALPAGWQAVDVLVNNAGLALGLEPAPAASLDDWETMIDTNCKGLAFMTRALLPGMVARARGHIVNIGSTAAEFPYPGGNCYGATKAFVYQFSLNLRADLAGTPLRVTDIEPGMCSGTEFSSVRFKGDDAKAAGVYAGAPGPPPRALLWCGPMSNAYCPAMAAAVAAAVAQGRADWGIAIDTVAAQYSLGFIPMQEEHYDFVVPKARAARPAVLAFILLLQEPALRQRLVALGFRL
jgi:NAD(P)-dependent dehydrogenase (short-subunit alcohol dehydrogenase family)